nr:PQQ-binding-like beta-propeller repeat protein [Streptomyces sp. NBC_00886]
MDVLLRPVPDGDADREEAERFATRLRAELRGLDIDALRVRVPFDGVVDGIVYVGSDDGTVHAIEAPV